MESSNCRASRAQRAQKPCARDARQLEICEPFARDTRRLELSIFYHMCTSRFRTLSFLPSYHHLALLLLSQRLLCNGSIPLALPSSKLVLFQVRIICLYIV